MLQLSQSLINVPVLSVRVGAPIAFAAEPIINPHNLKILGWWCKAPRGTSAPVLLVEDIRQVTPDGLIINDDTDLSKPEELARHKEILKTHFQLIDKDVKTKSSKLGKVGDYAYDSDSLIIVKLYVTRPLTKILSREDSLIIDRSQIIEITDKYILVRDADVKVTEEELATATEAAPAG